MNAVEIAKRQLEHIVFDDSCGGVEHRLVATSELRQLCEAVVEAEVCIKESQEFYEEEYGKECAPKHCLDWLSKHAGEK